MDQEPKEEFERYERKGGFPRKEPREPFSDESGEPLEEISTPLLSSLHLPNEPLTKKGLEGFLIELKPLIEEIQSLSRKDQHLLASYLHSMKNMTHNSSEFKKCAPLFEKIAEHFNALLIHSTPVDQKSVLETIKELELML